MGKNQLLPPQWKVIVSASNIPLQRRILKARGLITKEERDDFLTADFYAGFFDGWDLPDMKPAVERLRLALETGEAVAVYGDYDADGIPATALMVRALRNAGFHRVKGFIPTRKAGYGLREESVDELMAAGYTVAVTVDTGITAHAVALRAKKLGLDLIITDHHEVVDDIPKALAVIDPKRPGSRYQNTALCGTAVAYKLLWSLYEELGLSHTYLKWQLDLVAVATIADMVPLIGENRVLAKVGLLVLRKTRNYGLRSLLQVAGINYKTTTARDVMYSLAPRINALSRLGQDDVAPGEDNPLLLLLTTSDESKALSLAVRVNDLNQQRQALVAQYVDQVDKLENRMNNGGSVLFVANIPSGLTGLIAGKLADASGWPALILAQEGDEIRGSGRSPTTMSMVDLLSDAAPLLTRFGGHRQAAGWSMPASSLPAFIERARAYLAEQAKLHPQGGEIVIDTVLQPHEATLGTAQGIAQLEPFGMNNREPLLLWHDKITAVNTMGQQRNHWRIATAAAPVDIVYFGVPATASLPSVGSTLYAAVTLGINTYTVPKPQLTIKHYYVG